jgi:multicomponent Na+:H+ antiporter subunit C
VETFLLIALLFIVGFWGLVGKYHLVKKVIGFNILSCAVITLFIYQGSLFGVAAPILVSDMGAIVDPVPQALMLTAIVIGVCLTALALALAYRIFREFGSMDIRVIESRDLSSHE